MARLLTTLIDPDKTYVNPENAILAVNKADIPDLCGYVICSKLIKGKIRYYPVFVWNDRIAANYLVTWITQKGFCVVS